jgi:hypothetical protein
LSRSRSRPGEQFHFGPGPGDVEVAEGIIRGGRLVIPAVITAEAVEGARRHVAAEGEAGGAGGGQAGGELETDGNGGGSIRLEGSGSEGDAELVRAASRVPAIHEGDGARRIETQLKRAGCGGVAEPEGGKFGAEEGRVGRFDSGQGYFGFALRNELAAEQKRSGQIEDPFQAVEFEASNSGDRDRVSEACIILGGLKTETALALVGKLERAGPHEQVWFAAKRVLGRAKLEGNPFAAGQNGDEA